MKIRVAPDRPGATVQGSAGADRVLKLAREAYYGARAASNILDLFATQLATLPLKPSNGQRIRLQSVAIEDAARETIAAHGADPVAFACPPPERAARVQYAAATCGGNFPPHRGPILWRWTDAASSSRHMEGK